MLRQITQNQINATSSHQTSNNSEEINISIPHHDSERSRDLRDKASVVLPKADRHDLKQLGAVGHLKLLQRTSDCLHWGSVLNAIKTNSGEQSFLWNYHSIKMEDITNEAVK